MEFEKIEQWAEGLLTVAVVAKEGEEHDIWLLLRHLFIAVKIHDDLQPEEKKKVQQVIKLTKGMFFSKFSVKDKKTKKEEIKKNTPAPQVKNKEEYKEEKKKTLSKNENEISKDFEARKEAFRQEVFSLRSDYDDDVLKFFFEWATEPNKTKTKMRFESKKYWDTKKRLARWASNYIATNNAAAAIRLNETKKRQSKEAKSMEEQQVVAAARIEHDAKWEQEMAETKRNAVSYEEWLALKAKEPTPDPSRGEGE